ncbi:MAG: hypothetical protein IT303_09485 [Dehalococcoidia bacterium]|nr:hypothetical protein [Dehalococcoidia bacterium]
MIHLVHGANTLGIRRRLDELKEDADGGSGMLATNYIAIDGRDAKPHEILGPCMAPPFLAPQRLVVVDNLLERYEQKGDQRGPRSLEPVKPLLEGLKGGLPPTTTLVFVAHHELKRNNLYPELKKLPGVIDEPFPELKKEELIRFIREEAAIQGIKFRSGPPKQKHFESEEFMRGEVSGDPAALLALLTNGDTLRIGNELQKLALYTLDRDTTVDDVYECCAGDREMQTLQWADIVMDGKLYEALDGLHVLRSARDYQGDVVIVALLIGRYRSLATIIDLLDRGATPEEIGKAMGPAGRWPNLRDKAIARARKIGPDGLRRAYAALIEAERTNKTGEVEEEIATEILVGKLARRA